MSANGRGPVASVVLTNADLIRAASVRLLNQRPDLGGWDDWEVEIVKEETRVIVTVLRPVSLEEAERDEVSRDEVPSR